MILPPYLGSVIFHEFQCTWMNSPVKAWSLWGSEATIFSKKGDFAFMQMWTIYEYIACELYMK